jgi:hypothetical protein
MIGQLKNKKTYRGNHRRTEFDPIRTNRGHSSDRETVPDFLEGRNVPISLPFG